MHLTTLTVDVCVCGPHDPSTAKGRMRDNKIKNEEERPLEGARARSQQQTELRHWWKGGRASERARELKMLHRGENGRGEHFYPLGTYLSGGNIHQKVFVKNE